MPVLLTETQREKLKKDKIGPRPKGDNFRLGRSYGPYLIIADKLAGTEAGEIVLPISQCDPILDYLIAKFTDGPDKDENFRKTYKDFVTKIELKTQAEIKRRNTISKTDSGPSTISTENEKQIMRDFIAEEMLELGNPKKDKENGVVQVADFLNQYFRSINIKASKQKDNGNFKSFGAIVKLAGQGCHPIMFKQDTAVTTFKTIDARAFTPIENIEKTGTQKKLRRKKQNRRANVRAYLHHWYKSKKPKNANMEAAGEVMGTDFAKVLGRKSQNAFVQSGSYKDGSPKVVVGVEIMPGYSDLEHCLAGGDRETTYNSNYVDKGLPLYHPTEECYFYRIKIDDEVHHIVKIDKNGVATKIAEADFKNKAEEIRFNDKWKILQKHTGACHYQSVELSDPSENLFASLVLADKDGIGSRGQNKGDLTLAHDDPRRALGCLSEFFGIDDGKALSGNNNLIKNSKGDLDDAFNFMQPSTSKNSMYVHLSSLNDGSLAEKMKGIYLYRALLGNISPTNIEAIAVQYEELDGNSIFADKLRNYISDQGLFKDFPNLKEYALDNPRYHYEKNGVKNYIDLDLAFFDMRIDYAHIQAQIYSHSNNTSKGNPYTNIAIKIEQQKRVYLKTRAILYDGHTDDNGTQIDGVFATRSQLMPNEIVALERLEQLSVASESVSTQSIPKDGRAPVKLKHLKVDREHRIPWTVSKAQNGKVIRKVNGEPVYQIDFRTPPLNKLSESDRKKMTESVMKTFASNLAKLGNPELNQTLNLIIGAHGIKFQTPPTHIDNNKTDMLAGIKEEELAKTVHIKPIETPDLAMVKRNRQAINQYKGKASNALEIESKNRKALEAASLPSPKKSRGEPFLSMLRRTPIESTLVRPSQAMTNESFGAFVQEFQSSKYLVSQNVTATEMNATLIKSKLTHNFNYNKANNEAKFSTSAKDLSPIKKMIKEFCKQTGRPEEITITAKNKSEAQSLNKWIKKEFPNMDPDQIKVSYKDQGKIKLYDPPAPSKRSFFKR